MVIHGYDIRVIHANTGEIIRTLTIDPERRYHGTGRPSGGPKGPRKNQTIRTLMQVRTVLDVSRQHSERMTVLSLTT
jgi:hypothetical protein